MREYSPLSSIMAPLITLRFGGMIVGIVGNPRPIGLSDAEPGDHAGHVVGHVAQVAPVDAHRQIDRRLEIVVRDFRRHG